MNSNQKFKIKFLIVAILLLLSGMFKIWWPTRSFEGAVNVLESEHLPYLLITIVVVVIWKFRDEFK